MAAGVRQRSIRPWPLEIMLTSPGSTTTHFFIVRRSRLSDIVHLRAAWPLTAAKTGALDHVAAAWLFRPAARRGATHGKELSIYRCAHGFRHHAEITGHDNV